MRTVYRIVERRTGAVRFEGSRSKVLERLSRRYLAVQVPALDIEVCQFEPKYEACPKWKPLSDAQTFISSQ